MINQLTSEVTQHLDSFVTAFGTFDGACVAQLFRHPYMAVDEQGKSRVFAATEDTAVYFQEHLDRYQSIGSKSCGYHTLKIVPLGKKSALVTVTWSLKNVDSIEISCWRESYCVSRHNGKLLAYASIDHAT